MPPTARTSRVSTTPSWCPSRSSTRSTTRSGLVACSTGPIRAPRVPARSTTMTADAGCISPTPRSCHGDPHPPLRVGRLSRCARCLVAGARRAVPLALLFPIVVGQLRHMLGQAAGRDVGQGGLFQHGPHAGAQRPPDVGERGGRSRIRQVPSPMSRTLASGPSMQRRTSAMLMSLPERANS